MCLFWARLSAYSSGQFFPGTEPEGCNKLSCNYHQGIGNPEEKVGHTQKNLNQMMAD